MEPSTRDSKLSVRERLFHLPDSLFKGAATGKSPLMPTSLMKGLGIAAAVGVGVVGLASVASFLKNRQETDDSNTGEGEPEDLAEGSDVSQSTLDTEVGESTVAQTGSVKLPSQPDLPPPPVIKQEPEAKPPSFLDKLKGFFTGEDKEAKPEAGLAKGKSFASGLSGKLDQSFRGPQTFQGFKKAAQLSKHGRYTDGEAARVQALMTSGADTSANAGKMSKDIEDRIRFFSAKHGMDPSGMLQAAQMESGGNPNAISETGAIGIFQFTGRTASEAGITDRFDPDQNIEAGVLMAKKASSKLTANNLPTDGLSVYLMHQLGVTGGLEVIKAAKEGRKISDLNPGTQRAVKLNFGGSKAKTAKEYVTNTQQALAARSTPDKFASGTTDASETAPVVQVASTASTVSQVAKVEVPKSIMQSPQPMASVKPVAVVIPKTEDTTMAPNRPIQTASLEPVRQQSTSAVINNPTPNKPTEFVRTKSGVLIAVA